MVLQVGSAKSRCLPCFENRSFAPSCAMRVSAWEQALTFTAHKPRVRVLDGHHRVREKAPVHLQYQLRDGRQSPPALPCTTILWLCGKSETPTALQTAA